MRDMNDERQTPFKFKFFSIPYTRIMLIISNTHSKTFGSYKTCITKLLLGFLVPIS